MNHQSNFIISGASIITEEGILQNSAILIKDHLIKAIISRNEISQYASAQIIDFPEHYYLAPGFIDMHIHGANGKDVMDANKEALADISKALLREGTTSWLATTMTAPVNEIENVLCNVRDYIKQQDSIMGAIIGAQILGVHLEGPFLSPEKVGAQCGEFILNPEVRYVEHWQKMSGHIIKLITLAPELTNSLELIRYLKEQQIIASFGHTNATYAETMQAIEAGCTYATHLFNAMRGIHQREPGAVTAGLLSEQVVAELIVDGIHLHPAILELIIKLKGVDKMVLVTDAMRAKCLCDGEYNLGGQSVMVHQGVATLKTGVLAGSTLKMNSAVKNLVKLTDCSVLDAIKMASENPARVLGVFDKKGSIAVNKEADLVVLNEKLDVITTISRGVVANQ